MHWGEVCLPASGGGLAWTSLVAVVISRAVCHSNEFLKIVADVGIWWKRREAVRSIRCLTVL